MARKPGQLSANQRRAIDALLRTSTVADAARVAGLATRTLWRYLQNDAFLAELRRRQDAATSGTVAALVGLTGEAIAALRALLDGDGVSDAVKARVGLGVLAERHRASEIEILREVVRLLRLDIAEAKEAKRKAEAAARAERAEALQPAYNASIETAFNAAFDLVAAIAAYRESEREILRLGGETANAVFTSDFIKRLRGELQRWSCIGAGYDRRLSFKLNERLPLNDLLPR